MSTTILIDGNNVGMAAHFANAELTDMDRRPVGAIFGFLRSLRPILVRVQGEQGKASAKIIVAWDSAQSWRKEMFEGYKISRTGDPNEQVLSYYDQLPRLKNVLPMLGVSQVSINGYEADDLAGWFAHRIPPNQLVLVSNDRDWLQLVGPQVHLWQPMKERYVTPVNFEEVTEGCRNVEEFVHMKALMGDKGDDVPGCKGVGEKTALKYLRGELKAGAKLEAIGAWIESEEGFDRSKKLVDLRNIQIDVGRGVNMRPGKCDPHAFMNECMVYGFNSILNDLTGWLKPFIEMSE